MSVIFFRVDKKGDLSHHLELPGEPTAFVPDPGAQTFFVDSPAEAGLYAGEHTRMKLALTIMLDSGELSQETK